MDYFFYSGLKDTAIKNIVASYDIACQWYKKFYARASAAFPASWPINNSSVNIRFLVPKFHLPAHIEKCHQDFSFNYTKNVGRTDGEAPERGWANINGIAYSTREMGPGSRQDTIEDHLGDWNWKKVVGMGKTNIYDASLFRFTVRLLTFNRFKPPPEDQNSDATKGQPKSGLERSDQCSGCASSLRLVSGGGSMGE
jgi:hypothetical protein